MSVNRLVRSVHVRRFAAAGLVALGLGVVHDSDASAFFFYL